MQSHRTEHQRRATLAVTRLEDRATPSAPVPGGTQPAGDASGPGAVRAVIAALEPPPGTGSAVNPFATQVATTTVMTVTTAAPVVNKPLNLVMTVRPATGADVPTGTVTVKDGDKVLGTVALKNGQAQFSNSGLAAGVHRLSIAYSGDGRFAKSTSATATITIAPAAAEGTGKPSLPTSPSAIPTACVIVLPDSPAPSSLPITLRAAVRALRPTAPPPTGRVTFRNGSTVLGFAALDPTGIATLVLPAGRLKPGQYYLSAYYEGDARYSGDAGADLIAVSA